MGNRYRVHDGPLLARLMRCPDQGGTAHTVRSLAKAVGLSWSKIHRLITEDRPTVTRAEADHIAESLGVSRRAIFQPISSPLGDGDGDRK